MNKIQEALIAIHKLDRVFVKMDKSSLHPLSWSLVSLVFLITVISFNKYNLLGVLSLFIFILVNYIYYELSLKEAFKRLYPLMLLSSFVGVLNPFFDDKEIFNLDGIIITAGFISLLTLFFKSVLCLLATNLLFHAIGMNGICYSLKCIHVPSVLISMLYLMYRYLLVLLKEINNMYQIYLLRAPNQKGIAFKYWGVFIGQLLLRTITRAQSIYQSMLLRGYKGDFYLENKAVNVNVSFVYVIVWCTIFIVLRNYNVLKATGDLFI